MFGIRVTTLVLSCGLLALSACCRPSSPIKPTQNLYSCSVLNDNCTANDAGQSSCADHTYCDPIHKSDPDYQNADAVAAGCRKCYFESRQCQTNADCCPGQQCNASLNLCFDCYNLDSNGNCGQSDCTNDATCSANLGPGHICEAFNSPDGGGPQIQGEPPSMRCSYPTCHTDSDCATGASCFPEGATPYGYCVSVAPCGGPCAAGTACSVTDDLCSTVPLGKSNCQQSCAAGSMLVFKDESVPTGVYDACNRPAVDCTCAVLPPIRSNDLGRYSSLSAQSGQVWVSGYDGQYGDLVAFHFSPDGGLIDLEYVDGVPNGTVVADPNGPRGGVAAPGPNVGQWTSLVLGANGQPQISYYDVDHKSLKYAARQSSGSWTVQWVDGWNGTGTSDGSDVGSYSSIAFNGSGNPAIAYFQAGGPTASAPLLTGVKLAQANVPNPASSADWTVVTVDSAFAPAPPCYQPACTIKESCIGTPQLSDGGPIFLGDGGCQPAGPLDQGGTCLPTAASCGTGDAGCSSTEACVLFDGGAACMPTFPAPTFNDLPQGIGLFTSLTFASGVPVVAYYDRLHGDLRLAQGLEAGGFAITTLDGTDPASCDDTGDVGMFPTVKVNGGNLAVAYQSNSEQDLLYWTGSAPAYISPAQRIVVDTGTMQPPAPNNGEDVPQFEGANVSLAFGASGTAYFAYQNQTDIALRLTTEPPGCGTASPASCTAAVQEEWGGLGDAGAPLGFYSQVAIDGTQGYLSSAQIKALTTGVDDELVLEPPEALR